MMNWCLPLSRLQAFARPAAAFRAVCTRVQLALSTTSFTRLIRGEARLAKVRHWTRCVAQSFLADVLLS